LLDNQKRTKLQLKWVLSTKLVKSEKHKTLGTLDEIAMQGKGMVARPH
jgi:hypothetical protein